MPESALYIAAGALVGSLVGLTGVGGGSLMTPILLLVFGQSPTVAVGTDLVFAAVTKAFATGSYGLAGCVDWPLVRRLALGSLPGATLVLLLLAMAPPLARWPDAAILLALGALLLVTAASMLLRLRPAGAPALPAPAPPGYLTVLVGAIVGIAVTLTSIGAGALGTVALFYLYPQLRTDRLVATDIAHAVPLTLLAGLGHATLGHVDGHALQLLLTGSLPAVLLSSRLAQRLSATVLRALLATLLAVVGIKILLGH